MTKLGNKAALKVNARKDVPESKLLAEVAADPAVTAGFLATAFGKGFVGEIDLTAMVEQVRDRAAKVRGGNLGALEDMLTAQATALNAMFGELARRGALNMGEYIEAADRYLRLALKAQMQCRATLETLAAIKNPPLVIAKQANFAAGPQQVNNGTNTREHAPAPAEDLESSPNGLLEANGGTGERLDFGAAGTSSSRDPALAAVGAIDGPAHG